MPNTRIAEPPIDMLELESLRGNLAVKRGQLIDLYEHDLQVGKESSDDNSDDFADRANNAYNREFNFSLSDGERRMLIQVEEALGRLDDGTYGECRHCEEAIGLARLKALPWARYCIDCQERKEKGLLEG